MKYTPGTDIILGTRTQAKSVTGPQPLNMHKATRTTRNQYFEPGIKYTLYNIRPLPNNTFEYTFNRSDGKQVAYNFDSVQSAERVIAVARGEAEPNYDNYYAD